MLGFTKIRVPFGGNLVYKGSQPLCWEISMCPEPEPKARVDDGSPWALEVRKIQICWPAGGLAELLLHVLAWRGTGREGFRTLSMAVLRVARLNLNPKPETPKPQTSEPLKPFTPRPSPAPRHSPRQDRAGQADAHGPSLGLAGVEGKE